MDVKREMFDDDMPLERDEEAYRAHPPARPAGDAALDLLFRTRIGALKPKAPVAVAMGTSVAEACRLMRENKIGSILIMDGRALVGIFTERDVLYKVTSSPRPAADIRIEELMTPKPTTLGARHRLAHALNKMTVDGCRHIPIVDEHERPIGVLSVRRIVDFLSEQFPGELLTLPPDPDQAMKRAEGG